jgi:hypothetical protein
MFVKTEGENYTKLVAKWHEVELTMDRDMV